MSGRPTWPLARPNSGAIAIVHKGTAVAFGNGDLIGDRSKQIGDGRRHAVRPYLTTPSVADRLIPGTSHPICCARPRIADGYVYSDAVSVNRNGGPEAQRINVADRVSVGIGIVFFVRRKSNHAQSGVRKLSPRNIVYPSGLQNNSPCSRLFECSPIYVSLLDR